MTTTQAAWLAGVIDSEGSFGLRRGKTNYVGCLRVATTDSYIIPRICEITNKTSTIKQPSGQAKTPAHTIKWVGGQCKLIIESVIDHLYTKRKQAEYVLEALNIKAGMSSPYSDVERTKWYSLKKELEHFNQVGLNKVPYPGPSTHQFSWPWLAGFIDGDGSVYLLRNKVKGRLVVKPVLTISSSHLATMEYIASKLNVNHSSSGMRGNRSPHRKLRLTSSAIMRVGHSLLPHLVLKQNRLQTALEIIENRQNRRFSEANQLIAKWI